MRFAYSLLTYLLTPVYALYWFFRGLGNRDYHDRFGQRFGIGYPRFDNGSIWIHAVSVGEVQATVPLVRTLQSRFADKRILMTTVTPTGAARVRLLFGDTVTHSYIPFETPVAVARFFSAVRPEIALIMETEIWPNLYQECGRLAVPLVLVSARISPRSVHQYRRFLPLFRETLSYGIVIAAQSEDDAERFRTLGAAPERTMVTGNIKFDIEMPDSIEQNGRRLRRRHFDGRPVWIAASTHDKEEEMVLTAHQQVLKQIPDAVLVLVPRHPERFAAVRNLLQRDRWQFVTRTSGERCGPKQQVFLLDTMGEVPDFYAASDVAFVGGTLVPAGGHNLLEPAALGRPVVTGPHLHNTLDIARMFADVGASIIVSDVNELHREIVGLLTDTSRAAEIGARGRKIVQENRGSLDRLMTLVDPLLARSD